MSDCRLLIVVHSPLSNAQNIKIFQLLKKISWEFPKSPGNVGENDDEEEREESANSHATARRGPPRFASPPQGIEQRLACALRSWPSCACAFLLAAPGLD
jgi:hypothetical protein